MSKKLTVDKTDCKDNKIALIWMFRKRLEN